MKFLIRSMINHDRKRDLLAAPRSGSEAAGKHESRIRIEWKRDVGDDGGSGEPPPKMGGWNPTTAKKLRRGWCHFSILLNNGELYTGSISKGSRQLVGMQRTVRTLMEMDWHRLAAPLSLGYGMVAVSRNSSKACNAVYWAPFTIHFL